MRHQSLLKYLFSFPPHWEGYTPKSLVYIQDETYGPVPDASPAYMELYRYEGYSYRAAPVHILGC